MEQANKKWRRVQEGKKERWKEGRAGIYINIIDR